MIAGPHPLNPTPRTVEVGLRVGVENVVKRGRLTR